MTTTPAPSPLTAGACRRLAGHLSAAEWNKDPVKCYRASLLSKRIRRSCPDTLPEVKDARNMTREEERAVRAWLDRELPEISLSEKERELSREAVNWFIGQGRFAQDDDTVALMDAIGMKPEAV